MWKATKISHCHKRAGKIIIIMTDITEIHYKNTSYCLIFACITVCSRSKDVKITQVLHLKTIYWEEHRNWRYCSDKKMCPLNLTPLKTWPHYLEKDSICILKWMGIIFFPCGLQFGWKQYAHVQNFKARSDSSAVLRDWPYKTLFFWSCYSLVESGERCVLSNFKNRFPGHVAMWTVLNRVDRWLMAYWTRRNHEKMRRRRQRINGTPSLLHATHDHCGMKSPSCDISRHGSH